MCLIVMSAGGICASGMDTGPLIPATAFVPNVGPTIKLMGQPILSINSGESFAKCDATATLDTICDRGATATDEEDGKDHVAPGSSFSRLEASTSNSMVFGFAHVPAVCWDTSGACTWTPSKLLTAIMLSGVCQRQ